MTALLPGEIHAWNTFTWVTHVSALEQCHQQAQDELRKVDERLHRARNELAMAQELGIAGHALPEDYGGRFAADQNPAPDAPEETGATLGEPETGVDTPF